MLGRSDTFSVDLERSNGVAHLRLVGRFDAAAVHALDDAIDEVRRGDVVLDLEAVKFMDSAAWLAVVGYERRLRDWGMQFRLVNAPAHIRRIFELTATEYLLTETVSA
jgi:anti-anti-sigma factor